MLLHDDTANLENQWNDLTHWIRDFAAFHESSESCFAWDENLVELTPPWSVLESGDEG